MLVFEIINIPAPVFVKPVDDPLITPLSVNWVPATDIVLLLPKEIAPDNELVPVLVEIVPPFKVKASAPTVMF